MLRNLMPEEEEENEEETYRRISRVSIIFVRLQRLLPLRN